MKQLRWAALALSATLFVGCTGAGTALSPGATNAISALLGEFGFSLKTVDATTGQEKTLTNSDIDSVVDENNKAVPYSFDSSGKLTFKPNKEGASTIKVKMKDGSVQQFNVEGKTGAAKQTGDVAFIPDASGQGYTTKVAVGGTINATEERQTVMNNMADKRIKLTFGEGKLEGITKANFKGMYLDRMRVPMDAIEFTTDGYLKLDPAFFFNAREYFKSVGSYPPIRVAYIKSGTAITVVVGKMAGLPTLPDFTPSRPGEPPPPPIAPDKFTSNQTLDLALGEIKEYPDFAAAETAMGGAMNVVGVGATPPPPDPTMLANINKYGVSFNLPATAGLTKANVKGMMIARHDRPVMDILTLEASGSGLFFKLDPMSGIDYLQTYRFAMNKQFSPFLRIFYMNGTTPAVLAIRVKKTVLDGGWWNAITFPNVTPPNPIPPNWMPPMPGPEILANNAPVPSVDLEVFPKTFANMTELDLYRRSLIASDSINP